MDPLGARATAPYVALLQPSEPVLWSGQPDAGRFSLRGAWYLIPFSLLWGGFALFWEYSVLTSHAGPLLALWGIPFVSIGLYMIFGRIPLAWREALRTWYVVTDQRVLIVGGGLTRRVTVVELSDLPSTQLDLGAGGYGSITFGTMIGFRPPPGWPTMGQYGQAPAFLSIPDAARVFQIIESANTVTRWPHRSGSG